MRFRKINETKHFEIDKFDRVNIEILLPQSRTPALEHKKKEILHVHTFIATAGLHTRTRDKDKYFMGIELVTCTSTLPPSAHGL